MFENFYVVYVNEEGKDPGYAVFEKIVQIFTDNYQVYLVVVAAVFFIGLAFWIYRYSSEPCMSYLIFSSFLFGFYALTGLRQTVATVLVVFIGTRLIEKRKFLPFLLVVLVAFTVHKSAICFLNPDDFQPILFQQQQRRLCLSLCEKYHFQLRQLKEKISV